MGEVRKEKKIPGSIAELRAMVKEFDQATNFKSLPMRAPKKKRRQRLAAYIA